MKIINMGSTNSKPDDVSDAAWDKVQQQKLDLIAEKEHKIKEFQRKRQEEMNKFRVHLADYCGKCHDVPGIMMILPSYRKECSDARAKILEDLLDQFNLTESMDTAKKVSDAIKRSY